MAADLIVIDRTRQRGNASVRLAGLIQEAQNLCDDLKANADHAWDTGDYTLLEAQFGLATGAGANFLALLGNVQTALGASALAEYVARVANQ